MEAISETMAQPDKIINDHLSLRVKSIAVTWQTYKKQAAVIAGLVKCLKNKQENMSVIPSTHILKVSVEMYACNVSRKGSSLVSSPA